MNRLHTCEGVAPSYFGSSGGDARVLRQKIECAGRHHLLPVLSGKRQEAWTTVSPFPAREGERIASRVEDDLALFVARIIVPALLTRLRHERDEPETSSNCQCGVATGVEGNGRLTTPLLLRPRSLPSGRLR